MDNKYNLDLSTLSKELRLLLEIIKTESDDCIISFKSELFTDIDWEFFLRLALHHRVYPLIYLKLIKMDENSIPPHVIQTLYQEYKKNTFQMLLLCGEMEQVSKLFSEKQISLLFLKGPVIAAELYGDISQRPSKDIDILVPITHIERAEHLLLNFGYEREECTPAFMESWKWRSHHVTYFHPQKRIQIELHWRLQPRPSNEPSFDELWGRKRVSALTKQPLYFLGKEDLFLYLISHGARHGWFRLRWLKDIDIIYREGLNFNSNNLMKKYKNHHIVGQAMLLASQLLNTPMDDEVKKLTIRNHSKKLAQDAFFIIKEISPLHVIASTKNFKKYLSSLKSYSQKFFTILILFYPSHVDAETLKLPESYHFLFFLLRPFLSVWRKIRKVFIKISKV